MRWQLGRRSSNVEDRRGAGAGSPFGGGRRMRIPVGLPSGRGTRRAGGIGGLGLVVIVVIALFLGVDPSMLLQGGGGSISPDSQSSYQPSSPEQEELADFVSVVLGDTEDTWNGVFSELGRSYQPPTLVLFDGTTESACGSAQSATGPFYCPGDQQVYLDMSFFDELAQRFGAPGDFAQAYVIAHEVGHHVQTLLGNSQQVGDVEANRASVMLELQADCFAGVWANHANRDRRLLEPGDIDEGLRAASAIGDDRLQRQAQGYVNPDSFTHGSAEQRVRWFRAGYEQGDIAACDTFNASQL